MSDDETPHDAKAHKALLQAINSLHTVQHIQKSSRNEPRLQQAEFELVKSRAAANKTTKQTAVGTNDLVKLLKSNKSHLNAGKLLKNVKSEKKVLAKPLEKPAAERIKRTLGYENVKKKLARWDAVVAKNRAAETQVFPLPTSETIYIDTAAHAKPMPKMVKSDLRLQMEEAEAKLKQLQCAAAGVELENVTDLAKREALLLQNKLTRDELHARRKELAYLKMRQSQKSAKERKQNKIKSKKYHKLLKRQKMQQQIKDFEMLQKSNPEAALLKLNALEKSRVLERASLRHKNTGTWAKNLQVRAKYDKDVRKDLAEQLQISRQLTDKKLQSESESEDASKDDEDAVLQSAVDAFNPWCASGSKQQQQTEAEQQQNWRQYWLQRNENAKLLAEHEQQQQQQQEQSQPLKVKSRKQLQNGWIVESLKTDEAEQQTIDDLFDAKEDLLKAKLSKKVQQLSTRSSSNNSKRQKQRQPKTDKDELENLKKLSFKNAQQRPIIDEELNAEQMPNADKQLVTAAAATAATTVTSAVGATAVGSATNNNDFIDPNKLPVLKLQQQHISNFADLNDELIHEDFEMHSNASDADDDADAEQHKRLTIAEAFEDDDIIAEFTQDKQNDAALKNTEIELSMPGWGAWAGAGISNKAIEAKRNRKHRLLLKLAEQAKRRDDNKGGLYINENASKHLRNHLVSDVPFPFTSLQDYEASIRAPIGRNFVPETAFRMLTRPAVITKKGQVIEPMNEDELLKPTKQRLRHEVDRRIKHLEKSKLKQGSEPAVCV